MTRLCAAKPSFRPLKSDRAPAAGAQRRFRQPQPPGLWLGNLLLNPGFEETRDGTRCSKARPGRSGTNGPRELSGSTNCYIWQESAFSQHLDLGPARVPFRPGRNPGPRRCGLPHDDLSGRRSPPRNHLHRLRVGEGRGSARQRLWPERQPIPPALSWWNSTTRTSRFANTNWQL